MTAYANLQELWKLYRKNDEEVALSIGISKMRMKAILENETNDATPREEEMISNALALAQVDLKEKKTVLKEMYATVQQYLPIYAAQKSIDNKLLERATLLVNQIFQSIPGPIETNPDFPADKIMMLYWRGKRYGIDALIEGHLQGSSDAAKNVPEGLMVSFLVFTALQAAREKHVGFRKSDGETYLFEEGRFLSAAPTDPRGASFAFVKNDTLKRLLGAEDLPEALYFVLEGEDKATRHFVLCDQNRTVIAGAKQNLLELVSANEVLLLASKYERSPFYDELNGTPMYVLRTKLLGGTTIETPQRNVPTLSLVTLNADGEEVKKSDIGEIEGFFRAGEAGDDLVDALNYKGFRLYPYKAPGIIFDELPRNAYVPPRETFDEILTAFQVIQTRYWYCVDVVYQKAFPVFFGAGNSFLYFTKDSVNPARFIHPEQMAEKKDLYIWNGSKLLDASAVPTVYTFDVKEYRKSPQSLAALLSEYQLQGCKEELFCPNQEDGIYYGVFEAASGGYFVWVTEDSVLVKKYLTPEEKAQCFTFEITAGSPSFDINPTPLS